jgi:hypothetical protein
MILCVDFNRISLERRGIVKVNLGLHFITDWQKWRFAFFIYFDFRKTQVVQSNSW